MTAVRHMDCLSLRSGGAVAEFVGQAYAGVRGDADADYFLDIGGEEIFGSLAGVAAGDQEIQARVHAAIPKGTNHRAAKFFYRSAGAFGGQDGEASCAQGLRAWVVRCRGRGRRLWRRLRGAKPSGSFDAQSPS